MRSLLRRIGTKKGTEWGTPSFSDTSHGDCPRLVVSEKLGVPHYVPFFPLLPSLTTHISAGDRLSAQVNWSGDREV